MSREYYTRCSNVLTQKIPGGGYNRHVEFIDAIKGFAIILVVIEHVVNGYLSSDFFPASKGLLWGIDNVIYGFHMQLFMMVSGYLFSRAYFNEDEVPDRKRILKRVFNHLAVYFVFSFIYGLVKIGIDALSGISLNRTITWVDITAIPIKPIDLFWYLYVLMLFYLVFSLERLKKAPPMIMMGILVLLSFCSRFISFPWFSVGNLLFYAIFFYMGILKEKRNKFLDSFWVTAISFVAAVALWILFWREPFTVPRLIHYTPPHCRYSCGFGWCSDGMAHI